MFELGKNTTANLETLKKSGKAGSLILIQLVKSFIGSSSIDFCIIENGGYRTAEQQKALFNKGVSKCDGYQNLSEHQKGLAVDLVPYINGKPSWHRDTCFMLAGEFYMFCKIHGHSVANGADWDTDGDLTEGDSWDACHHEYKGKIL